MPPKLLLLVQTVLQYGPTFIRAAPDEIFRTTHGVKQGCPLSCFLFVAVFEIPLRFLASQGVLLSAFADDVSIPITPKNRPTHRDTRPARPEPDWLSTQRDQK